MDFSLLGSWLKTIFKVSTLFSYSFKSEGDLEVSSFIKSFNWQESPSEPISDSKEETGLPDCSKRAIREEESFTFSLFRLLKDCSRVRL